MQMIASVVLRQQLRRMAGITGDQVKIDHGIKRGVGAYPQVHRLTGAFASGRVIT